jgi:dTDP-4-dehydrorhamnose 3,5-epimerase
VPRFLPTELPGVVVVEPDVHQDSRGFFLESYHGPKYRAGGIPCAFVQDNHSRSARHTLRGLHAQIERPQAKLLRVLVGEIFDVAVDIRRGSPTFARWVGVTLSDRNFRQLFVPIGFAHGFCVTSDTAEVEYKTSDVYAPETEIAIAWNDPAIGVRWPVAEPLLSPRDREAPPLSEVEDRLPVWHPEAS